MNSANFVRNGISNSVNYEIVIRKCVDGKIFLRFSKYLDRRYKIWYKKQANIVNKC